MGVRAWVLPTVGLLGGESGEVSAPTPKTSTTPCLAHCAESITEAFDIHGLVIPRGNILI
jgi:hypothetical protein